jgi:uncharacterized OB-fold protein
LSVFSVAEFRRSLNQGALIGSECSSCGEYFLPPRPLCVKCGSVDLIEISFKGVGVVKAITTIHVPLSSFKDRCPYSVGVIELDEGVSISGFLFEENEDKIHVGDRVNVVFSKENVLAILSFKKT